jgi:DNA-binding transcriptional MerR regulator
MGGQFARSYLGIGEVLVELRGEFPDISVSKIRFLEAEGLITPARSPSGYRRFGRADIDQLRFILTAQRDQYLPLRVIKERLDDRAVIRAGQDHGAGAGQLPRTEMISRRELLESTGIDDQQLAELEAHGLVRRVGRLYSQDALDIASTAAMLASYGVEARHLRTVRTAAERDVSLIEQVVAPTLRQRSPRSRDTASQTAGQIGVLLIRLHRAMIEAGLAEAGLPAEVSDSSLTRLERPRSEVPADHSGAGEDGRRRPGYKGASA